MSKPISMTVRCSKCGNPQTVTVFESVNTNYEENIPEKIICGELFNMKCPSCGYVSHMEYDMLYHDLHHNAMIWVIQRKAPDYEKKVEQARAAIRLPGQTTRIVWDMNALREKVACLETGRDDRIVELCKVFSVENLRKQNPAFDFRNAWYTAEEDGKEWIFLYDNAGKEQFCEFPGDAYESLKALYDNSSYIAQFNENYPLVDYAWAEEMMVLLMKEVDADQSGQTAVNDSELSRCVCPVCSQHLPEDSEFCQYCGTRLEASASQIRYERKDTGIVAETSVGRSGNLVDPRQKTSVGKKIVNIGVAIALVLLAAFLCAALLSNSSLRDENLVYQNELVTLQNELATLQSEITELETVVSDKEASIQIQKKLAQSYKKSADYFNYICRNMRTGYIGASSEGFKTDKSIIILSKGDTKKIKLTTDLEGACQIGYVMDKAIASINFLEDSWYDETELAITGKSIGVTIVTFDNSFNSEKFKIVIVVTD